MFYGVRRLHFRQIRYNSESVNFVMFGIYCIMEEKRGSDDHSQRQKMVFLRHGIQELAAREVRNGQTLKIMTDQFKAKQSAKASFQRQEFAESLYANFVEIHTFFEKAISQMTLFPILDKLTFLLSSINSQYLRIFKFGNEKWESEYKAAEQLLKNMAAITPFKSDMCLSCSENKWHQHIKSQKHQIFNLKIEDPFYYYNEVVVNQKEVSGQQTDHKKLQEKLSELALGVEMEQRCLQELLYSMNEQQKQVKDKIQDPNMASTQTISLPVMPMLRSIFHYANKANKKITQQIGVQTNPLPDKTVKIIEIQQPNVNQINAQKDKIQFKLMTQIADKTAQIKDLQLKILQAERIQADLKAHHNLLMEENVSLIKRNSILQGQLSLSKLKNNTSKFKLGKKKNSFEKTREDISTAVNSKSYNNSTLFNQQALAEKPLEQMSKIRGNQGYESKFKAQQTPNKTMFIPNLYQNQKVFRQSVTPGHPGSALSIERGSDKLEDDAVNSIVDFPSLRQSIHSNDPFHEKQDTIKLEEKKPDESQLKRQLNEKLQVNRSKKKLKQLTKKIINSEATNIKDWVRSQNHSPDLEPKNARRVGKIQDRQSLLRMLYDSEVKVRSDKTLDFDSFKKSYEHFVLKIVGTNDQEDEKPRMAKIKNLHKKSTISIKQYYRNDFIESKDQPLNKESESKQPESKPYPRFSTCFRDIMNNLFAEDNLDNTANIGDQNGKIVLNNQELRVITQILAYMIQMKVTNLNAYSKIKTIISIECGDKKKGSSSAEENKELKQSVSSIIRNHRKCLHVEGHSYCRHISVFIRNIAALMQQ